MSAIRSRDNRTEVALRRALHARGLRYRLHPSNVLGRPDIVFPRERIAIFVDGDFWHARAVREGGIDVVRALIRTPSQAYWVAKFERRVARDDDVSERLRADGWVVLRFWESEIKKDASVAERAIVRSIRQRRRQKT